MSKQIRKYPLNKCCSLCCREVMSSWSLANKITILENYSVHSLTISKLKFYSKPMVKLRGQLPNKSSQPSRELISRQYKRAQPSRKLRLSIVIILPSYEPSAPSIQSAIIRCLPSWARVSSEPCFWWPILLKLDFTLSSAYPSTKQWSTSCRSTSPTRSRWCRRWISRLPFASISLGHTKISILSICWWSTSMA